MWWSKLRRAFVGTDGALRAIWRVLIALAAWVLLRALAALGAAALLTKLFQVWNLTPANLHTSPQWAQAAVQHRAALVNLAADAVAAAVFLFPALRYRHGKGAWGLIAFGAGLIVAALGAGLFLLTDSMRLYEARAVLSWYPVFSAALCFLSAAAQGLLAQGYVFPMLARRGGDGWAFGMCVPLTFCLLGAWRLPVLGMVNALLLGLALCALTRRMGVGASVGFRFGLFWCADAVFGFPGCGGTALLRLYGVSERWFTGGNGGVLRGGWVTAVLVCAAAWLMRKELRAGAVAVLRRKKR